MVHYVELLAVCTITVLAVISPGPDFAFTVKTSMANGRLAGYKVALGIGLGISVHVAYTLLGFGLLLKNNTFVLDFIRYAGAAYLIWLGLSAWLPKRKERREAANIIGDDCRRQRRYLSSPILQGFLCNALNPKTMLFIVALFSQVISADTPFKVQIGYGCFIAIAHTAWFSFVARLISSEIIKVQLNQYAKSLDRFVGVLLMGLGINVATS